MAVKMEKLENSRVKLTVDIEADVLERALEEAYRKNVKTINIPGFRKGKAPRKLIERTYGPNVFIEDAVDILLPRFYQTAVEETKIQPVDQPDADIEQIDRETGATFTYEVDVYPEFELGEYKGFEVERENVNVTEEDVENVLKQQQERNSELIVVDDRTDVQKGDFSVIDYTGYVDGQPFSGGAAENQTLEIGSGQFIPGFEEQLVGLEVGETKEIQVTFPGEYHAEQLAGKEAVFKVTIKELKVKLLPELDDEFAKDISEHETLDALKAEIRKNLEDEATRRTTEQLENKLLELIADANPFEVPVSMIKQQAEHLAEHFFDRMQRQGFNEEVYLQMTGQSKEGMLAQFEPQAQVQITNDLILEAVTEKEGITASEDEVNNKIDEYLGANGEMPSELEAQMREYWQSQKRGIELSILRNKAMKLIVDNAQIADVEAVQGIEE